MTLSVRLWHVIAVQLLFVASLVWAADLRITDHTELTDGNLAIDDWVECVDKSDTTDNAAGSSRKCSITTLRTRILGAGSATAGSWPKIGSGTLLTTAEDGALEHDAEAFYLTGDAGNRGVIDVCHILRQDSAYTLTSQTTAQKIFNAATNGRITLEAGTYLMEGFVAMTAMSATSGNATFDLAGGTATLGTILWHGFGRDIAANGVVGTLAGSWSADNSLTAAPLVTGATATAMAVELRGTFEVTAAGTMQPRVALQTAAAAVVSAGSYLKVCRIGSTSMTFMGEWD